jgi:hypothetical protein
MRGSGEPEGGLRNSMLTMEVPVPQHDKMIVKIILFLIVGINTEFRLGNPRTPA